MNAVVRPPDRITGQLDPLNPFSECAEDRLSLCPRNVLADAGVYTAPQGKVTRGFARYVKLVWLTPMGRVAVGGPQNA